MRRYGLLGKTLGHTFSKGYFSDKFEREQIAGASYHNFELARIAELNSLLAAQPEIVGLNVTIPYKQEVIPLLDELSPSAHEIGAVNTIQIQRDSQLPNHSARLIGHNTDVVGFEQTLRPFLGDLDSAVPALVLGTGGASQAVRYVLAKAGLSYQMVSRTPTARDLSYDTASSLLPQRQLIINTTPVGTYPAIEAVPPLDTDRINASHVVIDLIYNPSETKLLRSARQAGAQTANGLTMLHGQAEAAWAIWNEHHHA